MVGLSTVVQALLVGATGALAKVNYPALPKDLTTPYQQRLAIYAPNAVSIGWNTYAQLNESCVQYGPSKDRLTARACSSSSPTTYPTSRTWSNVVVLSDLTPATTYYYKIVSTNSTVDHFLSPRVAGDTTPFAMNAVIDLGVYGKDGYTIEQDNSKRDEIPSIQPELNHTTIGRLAQTVDDYEFIIHPGDFAYADDWFLTPHNLLDGKEAYQAILEQFYHQMAPIAGRKPYMASPGNHEAACQEIPYTTGLCPEGQHNFTDFLQRFGNTMPHTFPPSSSSPNTTARALAQKANRLANPPFWYSFDYGMAHIVMINTETDFPSAPSGTDGSAGLGGGPFGRENQQLDFLTADLASVDRTVTPWIVVAGHRPWYTTGLGSGCKPCQKAFEHVLYKYGVDVGVFGHVHNSQRFWPVVNGTADPKGMQDPKAPLYLVAGGAGNIEGLSSVGIKPDYTAFVYADDYSYARLVFEDRQRLTVQFVRSTTGEVVDESVLFKGHKERFVVQ